MNDSVPGNSLVDAVPPKPRHPMEFLLKQQSDRAPFLKAGDLIEGVVLEKRGSKVFVDLGSRGTGIVYGREYYTASDIVRGLAIGDRLNAKIVDPDSEEGYVELSLREAGREKNWQEVHRLIESNEPLRLKIAEANRGGLIMTHLGIQGFLPASQLSQEHYPRVEGGDKEKIFEELKKLVGTELEVTVIDADPEEGKLIFSERSKEVAAIRERLAGYKVGDTIAGEVAGLVSFGAFVRFGSGLEGLVHISEIDWQLIANPADVLKVGEKVQAKIIGVEGDKVSLSLKALKEDPWLKIEEKYQKGGIVTGTVAKFNPFGAFVKLDEEIQGLAHISEFGTEMKMREMLTLGEQREFVVLSIEPKEHRLALGMPDRERGQSEEVIVESQRGEAADATRDAAIDTPVPEVQA